MKIIESKTEGKSPGRLSEDILVIMPDFIAVIDGVTPKSLILPMKESLQEDWQQTCRAGSERVERNGNDCQTIY